LRCTTEMPVFRESRQIAQLPEGQHGDKII
jgi:hypothetical protein